jgi:hypothetical protein
MMSARNQFAPGGAFGFVGVVISVEDLSASVWLWHQDGDQWSVSKVITIPAEPADADDLPTALKPFGAVPPLILDIDLSVDDRWLYVSCWGTGELKQYDVSDPFHPRETASVRLGGIVRREPHPAAPGEPLSGGPQMSRRRTLFAAAVDRLTRQASANGALLEALALSEGRGLPRGDRIWAIVASTLVSDIRETDIDDLLRDAAPYVMLDAEDGQSVYRLAHRTFKEHFLAHTNVDMRNRACRIVTA